MAIYDNSFVGTEAKDEFFSLQRNFPEYRFSGINFSQLKREEFQEALQGIQENTILLFLSASRDKDGNNYPASQMVKLILSTVDTPVYGNAMIQNISGFLGGRVQDYRQMAKDGTLLILDVLSSKQKIKELTYREDAPGKLVINNRVLMAYNLSEENIPKDAFLEDGVEHFISTYEGYLLLALLPLLAVVLFALYFLLSRMHSRKLFKELEEKNDNLLVIRDELEHKLNYDHLTELLNRQTILSGIDELLSKNKYFSCVLMDIDNLKELNEYRGYEAGDLYLSSVANRLKRMEKAYGAIAARYGGDEFLLIFPGSVLQEDSQELQELLSVFQRSITVGGETVYMNSSGGVAVSNGKDSPRQVVVSAGIAMESAKKKGKNRIVFYTDELRYEKEAINRVLKMLETAIRENAFYMVYQPQVDCKTRKVIGYESLMRIRNVEFLLYQLERYDIPHEYVVLEITESIVFEESRRTKLVFKKLVESGIQLHLDDFGTGYNSLSYLPYIPLNTVKMDKSILDNFLLDKGDVVKNVISIVHELGKTVIAEGVEEEWQYKRLLEYNCDVLQGYLFGGPSQDGKIRS